MRHTTRGRGRLSVAATVLYALGILALFAVSAFLRGGETEPGRWALVAVPVALFAGASLVASLAERSH
jgi:hypothetical protein